MPRGKPINRPFVTVVDGEPVKMKKCRTCGKTRIVTDKTKTSGFYPQWTQPRSENSNLTLSWGPECKICVRASKRVENMTPEQKKRRDESHRRTYAKLKKDPDRIKAKREQANTSRRKAYADWPEERKEAYRAVLRQRAAARLAKDPTYYSEARKRERRIAREEKELEKERVRRGGNFQTLVLDAGMCRRWLEAYQEKLEIESGLQLAEELGLLSRRVTAVLGGEQDTISVDFIDLALTNATVEVDVALGDDPDDKTTIWSVDDLYDLSLARPPAPKPKKADLKLVESETVDTGEEESYTRAA